MSNKNQLTEPFQLGLFELKVGSERYYSNTIDLWDMIPKYFYGKCEREESQNVKTKVITKMLPILPRQVKCNKGQVVYNVNITPAIIQEKDKQTGCNVSTYYYPSAREELVEEVLRKFIANGKGGFVQDDISVHFSLRDIQEELKKSGHTYSSNQIKHSLNVMSKTHIEMISVRGDVEYKGNIITALALASKGNGGTQCFCKLNPLVSESIKQLSFRKYDYVKCMQYKNPLARYLHKRMSHRYKQASKNNPYIVKLSTLFNDSGYIMGNHTTKNKNKVESALNEMIAQDIIVSFKLETIQEKEVKMKIVDYKIYIIPSDSFISDIISANSKEKCNQIHGKIKSNL
jgi:glutaredoxin-related protein